MTTSGAVLCVDAGTTVIKTVAFDAIGRQLAVAQEPTTVSRPGPGRSEQDMGEVWSTVAATVRAARAAVDGPVRAVALTAQGDGAWLVDAAGHPVRPAVLWNDARGGAVIDAWHRGGVLDEAFRRTGSLGGPGLPHAVLVVLRAEEPEVLARSQAVLTCGSWLFLRLTGVTGLDRSEASAPWLDLRTGRPADDLFDLYGVADLAHLVPPLVEEPDRVQALTPAAAAELGLDPGTPVILAPYDIATTAIGCGVTAPGRAVTVLGTTLCPEAMIDPAAALPGPDAVAGGLTLDLGCGGLVLRAFPTLAGTGVLDWAARLLGVPAASDVVALAADAPAGCDGLAVLPYLSPAGERAPFLDVTATGLLSGITFEHGRAHLARAVLEGLAHVVRDCLDGVPGPAADLTLCGGGAASPLWAQVIADVTGRPTVRAADAQVGAKGALVVALTAMGEFPDLSTAATELVRLADRREPDPATRELHDGAHARFLMTRELITPGWHAWAATREAAGV